MFKAKTVFVLFFAGLMLVLLPANGFAAVKMLPLAEPQPEPVVAPPVEEGLPTTPLWQFDTSSVVTGATVHGAAFLSAARWTQRQDSVLVAVTYPDNLGTVTKCMVISLDAKTGEMLWNVNFPFHDKVLKITAVPDQTNDGKEDAVFSLRFKISPEYGHTMVMNGETGEYVFLTPFYGASVSNNPEAMNPVVGDYDGDGKKNNLLLHSFQSVVKAYR